MHPTEAPEFNSVDASLWYAIAVHDFVAVARPDDAVRARLLRAVTTILDGYAAGTRYGIRMDSDGLLACGVPGGQLTWMDAKVGDHVVTPRIGKPVEVEALWINALRCAGGRYDAMAAKAQTTFRDAWLCINGDDAAHRDEARTRFLAPLQAHLRVAGLGHISEIADGESPHTPRGCPFQAWSTAELIRALARTARASGPTGPP